MRRLLPVIGLAVLVCIGLVPHSTLVPSAPAAADVQSDAALGKAFKNRVSALQVEGQGVVTKILPDDNNGSRHQRFIVRLRSGQTLLIAHNVDLAPRVPSIVERDLVLFYGEYAWNPRGGVIHWTHRDPAGRHVAGWLKHKGRTYQ